MKFITDHHTLQGHSLKHIECGCQDYAYSFTDGDLSVALVSDGCSSAPNSDIGARLVCIAASKILVEWLPGYVNGLGDFVGVHDIAETFIRKLVISMEITYQVIGKNTKFGDMFLDCTLLLAVRYKEHVFAVMFGDGYMAVERADGTGVIAHCDVTAKWDGKTYSAPPYPVYHMPEFVGRQANYSAGLPSLTTTSHLFADRGATWDAWRLPIVQEFDFGFSGKSVLAWHFEAHTVNSIAVSTDGLGTFADAAGPINLFRQRAEVFSELLLYPSTAKGAILKRKMIFSASKTWPKKGLKHDDDLGIASIRRTE